MKKIFILLLTISLIISCSSIENMEFLNKLAYLKADNIKIENIVTNTNGNKSMTQSLQIENSPYFNESASLAQLSGSLIAYKMYHFFELNKLENASIEIRSSSDHNRAFSFSYTNKTIRQIEKAKEVVAVNFFEILQNGTVNNLSDIALATENGDRNYLIEPMSKLLESLGNVESYIFKGWEIENNVELEGLGGTFKSLTLNYQVEHKKKIIDGVLLRIAFKEPEAYKLYSIVYEYREPN